MRIYGLVCLFILPFWSDAQKLIELPVNEEWVRDYEPFRLVGNVYYVGSYDLGVYLITTPQGNILINTGVGSSVPMIRQHIEKLGFKFADIKILLATHAHYDHVGALSEIKKLTGAHILINEFDAPVLADGGNSDYLLGGKGSSFAPVQADQLLHGQDTVKFGGMTIVVLHHPGHTRGACSFLFDVKDETRAYRLLIANLPTILGGVTFPSMATYPNVGGDYQSTFEALQKVQFDIWFASHANQFNLHDKRKPGQAYRPEAFIDRKGYDVAVQELFETYREKSK
jgi:metallo-beta-lactamase class B